MRFTGYLKEQLTAVVQDYKSYFIRTLGVTLTFTIICFVCAAFLLRYSEFDRMLANKQVSLISYFFYRYSRAETYSIVDLSKTVFIFFVSFFSVGLTRLTAANDVERSEISFMALIRPLTVKDILVLSGVLAIASLSDFGLRWLDHYSELNIERKSTDAYLGNWLFQLRIYLPLILFAIAIRALTATEKTKLTIKRILFLYVSLWLFNEFAFEVSIWVRSHIFALFLMKAEDPEKYGLFESFLSIPLVAFYFLGYHSAMASLRLTEKSSTVTESLPEEPGAS